MQGLEQLFVPLLPELNLTLAEKSYVLGLILLASGVNGLGTGFAAFLVCHTQRNAVKTWQENKLAIFTALFGGFLLPLSIAVILLVGRLPGVIFALGAFLAELSACRMIASTRKGTKQTINL